MRIIPQNIQLGVTPVPVLEVRISKLHSVLMRANGGAVTLTSQGSGIGLTIQDGECMSLSHRDFRDPNSDEMLTIYGIDVDSTTPIVEVFGVVA